MEGVGGRDNTMSSCSPTWMSRNADFFHAPHPSSHPTWMSRNADLFHAPHPSSHLSRCFTTGNTVSPQSSSAAKVTSGSASPVLGVRQPLCYSRTGGNKREQQVVSEYVRPVVMHDQQVASGYVRPALIVVLVEVQHARAMRYLVSTSRPESSFALSRPKYARLPTEIKKKRTGTP